MMGNLILQQDLIQQKQEERAKFLLAKSDANIAQIAFEIGFSEQSAFNRAVKRWTNTTPAKYRTEHQILIF